MYGEIEGWQFAGRQHELALLTKAVHGPPDRPRLAKIPGDAGIGKTRLLTEFLSVVSGWNGTAAIGCTAADNQHGPFDSLTSVLGPPVSDGGPGAPRLSPTALSALAGPDGLVLVVDDFDQASRATSLAVEQLLRHPPDMNLLLVLTYRPRRTANRVLAALGAAAPHWHTTQLGLAPLDKEAIEQLFPAHLCGQHRMTMNRDSGGNPSYLELLMALCQGEGCRAESILTTDVDLPHEAVAPLRVELDDLSAAATLVSQAAAVVGDSFELDLTAVVAEFDRPPLLVAIDELLAADLVRQDTTPGFFRFRHPVVRGVVYRSASYGWRLGAHARAAEALRGRNEPAVRLAQHLERAGRAGDPSSIDLLISAGQAIELREPDTAATWYRAALRLLGDGPEHYEKRLEPLGALARGAVRTGRFDECRQALGLREQLLSYGVTESEGAGAAVACAAELAQYAGRHTEARVLLRSAIARLSPSSDSTPLRLALAATTPWETGWAWTEDALIGAAGSGDPMSQALALGLHGTAALARGVPGLAGHSANESARLVDAQTDEQLARGISAVSVLGWLETHLERFGPAVRHFALGIAVSQSCGQWPAMVPLLVGLGTVHLSRGQFDDARVQSDRAVRLAERPGCEELRAMALTLRSRIALSAGATLSSLADSLAAGAAVTLDSPWWRRARLAHAAALLAHGEPARCLDLVRDAGGGAQLGDLPAWDHAEAYDLMSRAELALKHLDEGRRWAEHVHESAASLGLPGQLGRASVALGRAANGSLETLTYALKAIEAGTTGDQLLLAGQGHLLAAEALLAMAEPRRAEHHLDAVEAMARRCGAGGLVHAARAVRTSRRHVGPVPATRPPAEPHMLSQREFEIAELLSVGKTNRQIARHLEVSPKTVETHLGRIFTKLNVTSRAEIANMVGRASVIARPRRPATIH